MIMGIFITKVNRLSAINRKAGVGEERQKKKARGIGKYQRERRIEQPHSKSKAIYLSGNGRKLPCIKSRSHSVIVSV